MPSNKPQILIRTEKEVIDKIDKIANEQHRSRANLCEYIILKWIEEYENMKNK